MKKDRIGRIKARIAARELKLENLSIIKKLNAENQADKAELAELEAVSIKEKADRRRKDDNHAKILLGAAVLRLQMNRQAKIAREILASLNNRDCKWLETWCAERSVDLEESGTNSESVPMLMAPGTTASDKIGDTLKRVMGGLNEGNLGLFVPDLLASANQVDQAVLQEWFSSLVPPTA